MYRALNKSRLELRRNAAKDAATPEAPKASGAETADTEGTETEEKKQREKLLKEVPMALDAMIKIAIDALDRRKQLLEAIEAEEAKTAASMTVIDRDISDRFARAETAVERRMYRALAALIATRTGSLVNLLP
jgi:hypothetical protein